MKIPEYLLQGEPARLFPVLATTSKEGRTTSILLACLSRIDELGNSLISSVFQKLGKRAVIDTYTEVVFKGQKLEVKDRPDGLIVVRIGSREWSALVEAKVGNNNLSDEQIERYRIIAKRHKVDCVITISNQFATSPQSHPSHNVRKSRSKIPVYHWSWMSILTTADLLLNNDLVPDSDQALLLAEFRRFLSHESAGVRGFERMPIEWTELNRFVSAGGKISTKSPEALGVLEAWHQETKDLALILSRQTETSVTEKLSRKHLEMPSERLKFELSNLVQKNQLSVTLDIPDAAAPIDVSVDLSRRSIDVGMTMRAPEDRKSSKARINWLVKQIKSQKTDKLHIRLNWPGRSSTTQYSFADVVSDSSIIERDKPNLQVQSFHLYYTERVGVKFSQRSNFIVELESIVPEFYKEIGQNLNEWRKRPPQIKSDKNTAIDVSVDAISEKLDLI